MGNLLMLEEIASLISPSSKLKTSAAETRIAFTAPKLNLKVTVLVLRIYRGFLIKEIL